MDLPEHKQVQVTVAEPVPRPDQDVLDTDYVRAVEKMDLPDVGLEDVRRTLSGIPGSMTADFIEEREERL